MYEGCVATDMCEVICKGERNAWGYNESAKQISAEINVNFSRFDCYIAVQR
jgi:ferredoxin-like protein FixX